MTAHGRAGPLQDVALVLVMASLWQAGLVDNEGLMGTLLARWIDVQVRGARQAREGVRDVPRTRAGRNARYRVGAPLPHHQDALAGLSPAR